MFAAVVALTGGTTPAVLAQSVANGNAKYTLYCSGCHNPMSPSNNKDGIKLAATRNGSSGAIYSAMTVISNEMRNQVYPEYLAGNLTDTDLIDIAAYIDSFQGGAPAPGQLTVPSAANFGNQSVGTTGPTSSLTITKTGGSAVSVATVVSSNPAEFRLVSNSCSGTIASTCQLGVAFRPANAGARSGTITISSSGVGSPQPISLSGTGTATAPPSPSATVAVLEYFHAGFGHYFITAIEDEIAKLDAGTFAGWARTGRSFKVYPTAGAGTSGVCRFFSTAFAPKSSHFYTPSQIECASVNSNANWLFEAEVFHVVPVTQAGSCPGGMLPVYRLYNNGMSGAPNHRYTTDFGLREEMLAQGWIPEGFGANAVIMCAPL